MYLAPQIFVGDASDALARVYAALPRESLPEDARLTGELVGPDCRYSQTLPARIRFVDLGPGPSLLAEAIVPDPCFWTPDLPFMYSAELQLGGANANERMTSLAPTVARQPFGIRRLGVQGSSIYLDAKRHVLRGVRLRTATMDDLPAARQAASALYVDEPGDELLREASQEGVLLAVRLQCRAKPDQLLAELARIGRWPAVAMVVLDGEIPAGKELRLAARNTLLAQRMEHCFAPAAELRPWANLLWYELGPDESIEALRPTKQPLIVFRPQPDSEDIARRRKNCDRLQADLAPLGDFAGYFT